MVQMWGLEVERELPGNFAVSVGYVGNHGTHLFGEAFRSFGRVPTAERVRWRTRINEQIPITDVFSGQTAAKFEEVFGGPTASRNGHPPLHHRPSPVMKAFGDTEESAIQSRTAPILRATAWPFPFRLVRKRPAARNSAAKNAPQTCLIRSGKE